MCGIAGLFDPTRPRPADELGRIATAMAATLVHRGPDEGHTWVDAEAGAALGDRKSTRLNSSHG